MATDGRTIALQISGLAKTYPDRHADVAAVGGIELDVTQGHFYTLLGPSGCGKTTTLRCVAGLERPSAGRIVVDGQVMSNVGSRQFVPPARRPMGMVFQNYAIWPHLSVYENVAFPLKVGRKRLRRKDISDRVEAALAVVHLSDYLRRPATNMSGGQQQRLALARALVREPKILLLDEPLSNLDAKLRDAMRAELRSLQRRLGLTTIYVTHDQTEALSMSNRIAVMSGGRIVQEGTPREIYMAPRDRFVAGFIGDSNFLPGTVAGPAGDGLMTVVTAAGPIDAACPAEVRAGDEVTLNVRPADLSTDLGTAGSVLDCLVEQVLYMGEYYDYRLSAGGRQLLMRQSASFERLRTGNQIRVVVPSSQVTVFSDQHGVAHIAGRAEDVTTPADHRP